MGRPLQGLGRWICRKCQRRNEVIARALRANPTLPSFESVDVRSMIERSYREVRMGRVEAELLQTRGWTLQEFKDFGRQKLSEGIYANIDARMAIYDLGAELICSGWGEDEVYPTILTIKNPGVCIDHSRLGFWCIGSGATAAQMSLFSRNYSPDMNVENALYYVAEAKFQAEKAAGVGQRTDIFVEWYGGETDALTMDDTDALRTIFCEVEQRSLDQNMRETIGKISRVQKFKDRKA